MSTELKQQIRVIINQTLSINGLEIELTDDLSLIESGLLDSMSIVNVVQSFQNEFDIEIDFGDVTIENFDTVNVLTAFISERS